MDPPYISRIMRDRSSVLSWPSLFSSYFSRCVRQYAPHSSRLVSPLPSASASLRIFWFRSRMVRARSSCRVRSASMAARSCSSSLPSRFRSCMRVSHCSRMARPMAARSSDDSLPSPSVSYRACRFLP